MSELRLVGLSEDGYHVVLADEAGTEFSTPADDKLRAALRGDRARLGQLEIQMDSALRPRDIQIRIRAGESPEAVAALAQVSVDKIMPYCVPVLAERQYIAGLAGRCHVRRRNADGPARRLSDVVAERLSGRGVAPDETSWNAWRREDGRWLLQASYRSGERERTATFVFDAVGRYSLAEDDEAKWLTGERQATSKGPQPREAGHGGERRLSSVPTTTSEDLVTLSEATGGSGPDDPYAGTQDDDLSDDLTAVVRAVRETDHRTISTPAATPVEAPDFRPQVAGELSTAGELTSDIEDSAPDDAVGGHEVPAGPVEDEGDNAGSTEGNHPVDPPVNARAITPADEPETEATPERRRRTGRRASVPSWDEIMFGKQKND